MVPDAPDAIVVPEVAWLPEGIVEPLAGRVVPLVVPLEELPDSWPLVEFEPAPPVVPDWLAVPEPAWLGLPPHP